MLLCGTLSAVEDTTPARANGSTAGLGLHAFAVALAWTQHCNRVSRSTAPSRRAAPARCQPVPSLLPSIGKSGDVSASRRKSANSQAYNYILYELLLPWGPRPCPRLRAAGSTSIGSVRLCSLHVLMQVPTSCLAFLLGLEETARKVQVATYSNTCTCPVATIE